MAGQREGLTLRQQQRLTLTPEMRLTLSVLRMSGLALQELLRQQAEENPILSLPERRSDSQRGAGPSAFDVALETTAAEISLGDHLRRQLSLMDLAPDVAQAAHLLSWSLNDFGYLDAALSDLAAEMGCPLAQLEDGLAALQSCEPAGIGARSVSECLALQLVEHGVPRITANAAMQDLDSLANGDLNRAARTTGLASTELSRVASLLPRLKPYPGQEIAPPPIVRRPDIEVRLPDQQPLEIEVLVGTRADITLDFGLMQAARQEKDDTRLARYGAEAEALHRALDYRSQTLHRIVAWIVDYQIAFFRDGGRAMRPLTRDKLATELNLHPTTVGRAVAEKTLAHPGGVIPLAAFFTTQLGQNGPDQTSAFAVQTRIAELVALESEDAILTDDEIARKLTEDNVDIARRTVAKYRRWLNIPSSYDRKRLRAASRMCGRTESSE